MQRKFVTNLALVLTLNLLIKPFWILYIDRVVQNTVGTAQYGAYYSLLGFSFLLNILLDCGITNFNNKNISQNNHLLSKHFASIVMLRIILAIVYCIITFTIGMIIGYDSNMMKMLIALAFNQILISFILYLRSNLAGLHLFKTDSLISVLDRTIMIAICAVLLWTHVFDDPAGIRWFVYAQTFAYLLTAIITFVIVIDKAKIKRLVWRPAFFLMILKKSYPYAVLVLLMTFYNRIDTVMLERMLPDGAEQAGIYASAYRLLDATNMIAFLFAGLLLPIFARMLKLKHPVEEMVRLSFSLLIVPAIVIAICSFFFRTEIMTMLYSGTTHVEESSAVFGMLMSCFIPIASTYIFGTLLTANGNLKELNIMASIGMAINIILNLILIPKMQVIGSAYSSLTTQLLTSLAQVFMVQHIFRFKINYRLLSSLFAFIVFVILINYFSMHLHLNWVARFIIAAGGSFAIAFAFRLISIKNLFRILREEE
jgi:O-antigen/teichoic acid export membrane protein